MWFTVGGTLLALGIGVQALKKFLKKAETLAGKHVLITGGSEGMGLELAKLCIMRGAKVSIVARTLSKLETARDEIAKLASGVQVGIFAADVGDRPALGKAIQNAEAQLGPIDVCIAAAGSSIPKYFEELTDDDFALMMRVNYYGVVNLAKEVLPGMARRDSGHFCAICSMAAAVPFIGYAAYAPAKAACRSFVDVLRNEFADTKLQFHIACPPDTDTPGFVTENSTKPYETSHIWPECFNDVYPAKQVAEYLLDDLLSGEYFLRSPDFFGNLLVSRGWGHFPRSRPLLEAAIAPIFVGVHAAMVWMMDRAVRSRAHHSKESSGK